MRLDDEWMDAASLITLGHDHLAKASHATAGRSSVTVHGGQGHAMNQVLIALCAGHRLDEHRHTGAATLQVVHGTAVLHAGDESLQLRTGDHVTVPGTPHDLEAVEDTVVLLTIAHAG